MVIASGPGKVLICGGYAIVEHGNAGLTIGVSSRFRCRVADVSPPLGVAVPADAAAATTVVVESPQFKATFEYQVTVDACTGAVHVAQRAGPDSPFLFMAVLFSAASLASPAVAAGSDASPPTAAQSLLFGRTTRLVLEASNDFYSQRAFLEAQGLAVTAENLRDRVPPFNPIHGAVSKTGLGSSASLTTTLVAALHRQFGGAAFGARAAHSGSAVTGPATPAAIETIHRVAQVAHSVAQGKIGSGFDVFTAVYGTAVYRRFDPVFVEALLAQGASTASGAMAMTAVTPAALKACVAPEREWAAASPFGGLPTSVALLLADVHQGGSATPGMVAKVFKWRASGPEAGSVWAALLALNAEYLAAMEGLARRSRDGDAVAYAAAVARLAQTAPAAWAEVAAAASADTGSGGGGGFAAAFAGLRDAALRCRHALRDVGVRSGVEIEPEVLTPLLDATAALPGVLATGCPGAGGFDAVFALVLDVDGSNCRAVERFWETYQGLHLCPLLVRENSGGAGLEFE